MPGCPSQAISEREGLWVGVGAASADLLGGNSIRKHMKSAPGNRENVVFPPPPPKKKRYLELLCKAEISVLISHIN